MPDSYVLKVSANGHISLPPEVRARWEADRVVVVDLGDRIVLRPLPDDPVGSLRGKYKGRGPSADAARRSARRNDAADERRSR